MKSLLHLWLMFTFVNAQNLKLTRFLTSIDILCACLNHFSVLHDNLSPGISRICAIRSLWNSRICISLRRCFLWCKKFSGRTLVSSVIPSFIYELIIVSISMRLNFAMLFILALVRPCCCFPWRRLSLDSVDVMSSFNYLVLFSPKLMSWYCEFIWLFIPIWVSIAVIVIRLVATVSSLNSSFATSLFHCSITIVI